MRMYDLILKKRNGDSLTGREIDWMIKQYTKEEIPDYQMSAMLMAICFQGLNETETYELTMEMAKSGEILDLSGINGKKVDKHSTGGVGDKTSLVLAPIVAALGVPVAKMSGRGLGHTGGTIDKLESISSFSTELSEGQFQTQVNRIGIAIMGQTRDLAPADKRLYALRDVTATVDQISLIASSIMSKKLAAGADAILLDVKMGSGAFMKQVEDARALAREMVSIGEKAGKQMTAVISNMDEPLGCAIGNALEVREAVDTLKGRGPADFTELVETLGAYMLWMGDAAENIEEGAEKVRQVIKNGKALEKFFEFLTAQGVKDDPSVSIEKLPRADKIVKVCADESGFVGKIDAQEMGICSLILGGGRETKESVIDPAVGLILRKKVGDPVKPGDTLVEIHGNSAAKIKMAEEHFRKHYHITKEMPEKRPMIYDVLFSS
ncbi:MAG: pyrimidine-nucleoside phosphorylase [Anaerostipes sp.]|uniref:pyrimidine-nucleoside phosphorylase n=1 Tax=Anaerostipes sp. TaxID=1872530 RepID=UPI0039943784